MHVEGVGRREGGRDAGGDVGGVHVEDVEEGVRVMVEKCLRVILPSPIMSLLRDEQEDRQVELIAAMQGYSVPKMKRRYTTGSFKS